VGCGHKQQVLGEVEMVKAVAARKHSEGRSRNKKWLRRKQQENLVKIEVSRKHSEAKRN